MARSATRDYAAPVLEGMTDRELVAERASVLAVLSGSAPYPAWMTRPYAADAVALLDDAIAARR